MIKPVKGNGKQKGILFMNIKQVILLKSIRNGFRKKNMLEISKKSDCTYSHVTKVISNFEDKKLVKSKKFGRERLILLTKKGEEILDYFEIICEKLGYSIELKGGKS